MDPLHSVWVADDHRPQVTEINRLLIITLRMSIGLVILILFSLADMHGRRVYLEIADAGDNRS